MARGLDETKNIKVSSSSTIDSLKALLTTDGNAPQIWHRGKLLANGNIRLHDADLNQYSQLVAECAAPPLVGGMAEPKYVARCFAHEDVVRRDYVAVIEKDSNEKFVLKVLTRNNEIAYE